MDRKKLVEMYKKETGNEINRLYWPAHGWDSVRTYSEDYVEWLEKIIIDVYNDMGKTYKIVR
jgi:hypothetical protein